MRHSARANVDYYVLMSLASAIATVLFLTNLAAIVLVGALVFLAMGFRPSPAERGAKVRQAFSLAGLVIVGLMVPLALTTIRGIQTGRIDYRLRPVRGPQLALDSARAQPPSLILLDVRMPEMDGFEVCRRLKQEDRTRDVPVIFVSALQDAQERVRGFEVGGVDFVSKPFQEQEILARVRAHHSLRHMTVHLGHLVAQRTVELSAANEALQAEIDERIRAEEEIRRSRDYLKRLTDSTGRRGEAGRGRWAGRVTGRGLEMPAPGRPGHLSARVRPELRLHEQARAGGRLVRVDDRPHPQNTRARSGGSQSPGGGGCGGPGRPHAHDPVPQRA
jgi:CheY-like chemotaxis protein